MQQRSLLIALALSALPAVAAPQRSAAPPQRPADDTSAEAMLARRSRELPMDASLQDLGRLPADTPREHVRALAERARIGLDGDGRVHVELVAPEGASALPDERVTRRGGRADTRWRNRLDAWIPRTALVSLAEELPPGHHLARAGAMEPDDVTGEGPAAIGTDTWIAGGANGAGVTIAVIDLGFQGLSAARANGDAPSLAMSTLVNYTPTPFEADETHGTGCVEAAFDHCPGATWRLYKVDSLADLGAAVSDARANGADVYTHSVSWFNTGWADDSGAACAAAQNASNGDALFFTSAGNYAQLHWQGTFTPGTGSATLHDWVVGDETLGILLQPGEGIGIYLSWDTPAGAADYDLYLYDDLDNLLASSTAGGSTFESIGWTNAGVTPQTVHVRVLRFSGATLDLELFTTGGVLEHQVAAGSTTSPSNCTGLAVFSVGAVDWNDFTSPAGSTGILEDYSSRGPSNDGVTLPHLVGPTNTSGFTYPGLFGGFGGTSAATPNVAGAATTLIGTVSAYYYTARVWLVKEQARLERDWGAPGADNLYGLGGAFLVDHAPGTVWLARDWGNILNFTNGPYYTLDAAYGAVPSGGRIVALPGSYPEQPAAPLTKQHRLDPHGGSAVLGF